MSNVFNFSKPNNSISLVIEGKEYETISIDTQVIDIVNNFAEACSREAEKLKDGDLTKLKDSTKVLVDFVDNILGKEARVEILGEEANWFRSYELCLFLINMIQEKFTNIVNKYVK